MMNKVFAGISCSILLLISANVMAVRVVECVDVDGNRSFEARCPDGTTTVSEKKFYTGAKEKEVVEDRGDSPDVAITLYTIPKCDACDAIKDLLKQYQAPASVIDVSTDIELQRDLQKLSGGVTSLSVPTITIGDKTIVGYNPPAVITTLEELGFSKGGASETEEGATEENTAESGGETEPVSTADSGQAAPQ